MPQSTMSLSVSQAKLRRLIATVPSRARTRGRISNAMMVRCGNAILTRICTAFLAKSRGGVDEVGDKWKPLSPMTIAYRRVRRTRTERKRSSRPSQGLTAKQQERWWSIYGKYLSIYKGNKGRAAAVAWTILKKEGARTLIDKYGNTQVEILRDTLLLFKSLSPGASSEYKVFRVGNGEIVVGTNRPWAWTHHEGAGYVPQRRLWPEPRRWPDSWWQDIQEQVLQGLLEITIAVLKGQVHERE